jgi:hypothetical protein
MFEVGLDYVFLINPLFRKDLKNVFLNSSLMTK